VLRLDRDHVELVTLEDEWEFTRSYLWLEQLRMGPRLVLRAEIDDDALEYLVPPFTVQPLVENAVRHGLSDKRDGGTIRVVAGERDGLLHIEVTDDGVGTAAVHQGSGGIGVRAVTQRLIAHFGDQTRTWVDSAPGRGYSVMLTFPAEASLPAAVP
jgi:two-component system sensor histidine kinase LytS